MTSAKAEYGEVPVSERSKRTIVASATRDRRGVGTVVYCLVHATKGWEPAGACLRQVEDRWLVTHESEHGQGSTAYKTDEAAWAAFRKTVGVIPNEL